MTESQTKKNLLEDQIQTLKGKINTEKQRLNKEIVEPLIQQVKEAKLKIEQDVDLKYEDQLKVLLAEWGHFRDLVDQERIAGSAGIWHPPGTKVFEWVYYSHLSKRKDKTGKVGVVAIYDGTQDLKFTTWNSPKKGDLLVIILKKDGTPSKMWEKIAGYHDDKPGYKASNWLLENETPKTNE